jgi:hypothetical protein
MGQIFRVWWEGRKGREGRGGRKEEEDDLAPRKIPGSATVLN